MQRTIIGSFQGEAGTINGVRYSSSWIDKLRGLIGAAQSQEHAGPSTSNDKEKQQQQSSTKQKQKPRVIDTDSSDTSPDNNNNSAPNSTTTGSSTTKSTLAKDEKEKHVNKLPSWSKHWSDEFRPQQTAAETRRQKLESTRRIVRIAAERVLEPSAVALLGMSASLVLSIGAAEGALLCADVPFVESTDAAKFVGRYAFEQLLPSTVWSTQDANLVATAMGYDAQTLLRSLDETNPRDASVLLTLGFCETLRSMSAGFMLLAQLVRTGAIGAQAPGVYEERVRSGREPPILGFDPKCPGLVVRLCGRESNIISTSLRRMGRHIFPVFEEPHSKVSFLISQYSDGYRIPVFWSVRPDRYGSSHSWRGFPVSAECLMRTSTGKNILVLEADATNANDPLALGDQALDLNMDDASQAYRRIEEEMARNGPGIPFRTLKVFLGNSLEVEKSGGGHAYTLRHRVKYSKEVDVLIDSRAPILGEVLRWCDRVTSGHRNESGRKIILFQTSSRQYFLSLKLMMERYGYEIRDPLDWHVLSELPSHESSANGDEDEYPEGEDNNDRNKRRSLLGVLNQDQKQSNARTLQEVSRLTRLPRLVYYGKTAETVNAVQALVDAGGATPGNCCALLDKEDGTRFLEAKLGDDQINLVQRGDATATVGSTISNDEKIDSMNEQTSSKKATKASSTSGLHVICSSAIYDDLFRQVRQWTRMGYAAKDIQKELDGRYQAILRQSKEIDETVAEVTETEEKEEKGEVVATSDDETAGEVVVSDAADDVGMDQGETVAAETAEDDDLSKA